MSRPVFGIICGVFLITAMVFPAQSFGDVLAGTYLGGSEFDFSWDIVLDGDGNAFISSSTKSALDFPVTPGAYDVTFNGERDVYIAKFSSDLTTLLACTYLGGSGDEQAYNLTVDAEGNVYAIGFTRSTTDFPTTAGAFDETYNGGNEDVFVAKFDNTLSTLLACTLLGGAEEEQGYYVMTDAALDVYVAGHTESPGFPVTPGTYDVTHNGMQDVYICKMDPTLSTMLAGTFIGGSGGDASTSITFDGDGNILATGGSDINSGFPVTPGAVNQVGGTYVLRIDPTLTTLMHSATFGGTLGGAGYGYHVEENTAGEVYVAGETFISDHPVTPGAFQTVFGGGMDVFITKLDNNLSTILASTYLGGTKQDWHHHSMNIDEVGDVYVSGLTNCDDFPTTAGSYQPIDPSPGKFDVFISKFSPDLTTLLASTYFGGTTGTGSLATVFDGNDNIYISGWVSSADLPVSPGAFDTHYEEGELDCFVAVMTDDLSEGGISPPVTTTIPVTTTTTEPAVLVELAYFAAEPGAGTVDLIWETAAEVDNAGFNVYRSKSKRGRYTRLNDSLLPAGGTATGGAMYTYSDETAVNGVAYWYVLEDVDNEGTATRHAPVRAVARLIHGR